MPAPIPTPIYRFLHIDNLPVVLQRGGLHAPNRPPNDGLTYKAIHNVEIQEKRADRRVTAGPGGVIHDYVPFYFGFLSPMMFNLKTGRVAGYSEGQEPLIYLVTSAQSIQASDTRFVFSDGHGIAVFTSWFDDLANLERVDWGMVYQRYWTDNTNDMDRQRRKQAEFLIHGFCPWDLVSELAVIDEVRQQAVEAILARFPAEMHRPVNVRPQWYYY